MNWKDIPKRFPPSDKSHESFVPAPGALLRSRKAKPVWISNIPGLSIRQLEHIGDRLVNVASCEIVLDKLKDTDLSLAQSRYFHWAHRLITNENLASAVEGTGSAVETKIGEVYFKEGVVAALYYARNILFATRVWKEFERFLTIKEQQKELESPCSPLSNPVIPNV